MEQVTGESLQAAERLNGRASGPVADVEAPDLQRLRMNAFHQPGDSGVWRSLGRALRDKNQRISAAAAFARSITASLADTTLDAIEKLMRTGEVLEAQRLLADRLKIDSDDIVALRLQADLAAHTGKPIEAERDYRRCIDLCPSYVPARYGLSRLLFQQARLGEASNETERMLATAPTDVKVRTLKAAVAASVGNHEDAAALYGGLAAELPQHAASWLGLGHSYRTIGQGGEAIDAYRRVLDIPEGHAEAYWSLSNLKTYRFDADDVQRMIELADAATGLQAAYLHFALGTTFDDGGDSDRAFDAFARGNAAKRATINYDATGAGQRLRHWTSSITTEMLAARSGEGNPTPSPIFIVGLPRSGSTLVEQILGSHSLIESTAELPYLDRIALRLARRGLEPGRERANLNLDGVDLAALGQEYLSSARVHRKTAKPFFIDKSPGNFAHVGLIKLMLPNAKIIDVRRHPLGTVWSIFKQLFANGQPFAYDLVEIAQWYREYVAAMRRFEELMPHAALRLDYETLVNDAEPSVRCLLQHAGVAFERDCLRFYENGNAVRTPSSEQVRKPIYHHALDDWRRYQKQLSPAGNLLAAELDQYRAKAAV